MQDYLSIMTIIIIIIMSTLILFTVQTKQNKIREGGSRQETCTASYKNWEFSKTESLPAAAA